MYSSVDPLSSCFSFWRWYLSNLKLVFGSSCFSNFSQITLGFFLSSTDKSQVLYILRPSCPTHSRIYVTFCAFVLAARGPVNISSQYCLNSLKAVGKSDDDQFMLGGVIPVISAILSLLTIPISNRCSTSLQTLLLHCHFCTHLLLSL